MQDNPVWLEDAPALTHAHLSDNTESEICVIGGGVSGSSAAYHLQSAGYNVVLLEAGDDVMSGNTARSSAHLACVLDPRFASLLARYGKDDAGALIRAHMDAISNIESITQQENISCDFRRVPGFLVALHESQNAKIRQEADSVHTLGFNDFTCLEKLPFAAQNFAAALQAPDQAMVHVGKYMNGLARAFLRAGGRIFTRAPVVFYQGGSNAFAQTKNSWCVHAKHIVVATHAPLNDFALSEKQEKIRSYVLMLETAKNALPDFVLWGVDRPYHYVRTLRGRETDFLLVGGGDHKVSERQDEEEIYKKLAHWARGHFPQCSKVHSRWAGQLQQSKDGLAFIGRIPGGDENVYVITGDSGNGITYAVSAGRIIQDLMEGRTSRMTCLLDPARIIRA